MQLASADWQAIGAMATGAAAVVTAVMAGYTAKMAAATRRVAKETARSADAIQEQVALGRRQAAAAETTVEQTERTMGATLSPRLRVVRTDGKQAAVNLTEHAFSIVLLNEGPVPADLKESRLNLSPQFGFLEPELDGAIPSGVQRMIRCAPSETLSKLAAGRQPIPVQLVYSGPAGGRIQTTFVLRQKAQGDEAERWLVIESETDKTLGD